MKSRGIDPRANKLYDFRCTLRDVSNYPLNLAYNELHNLSTLDGINALALTDGVDLGAEVFDTHNANVAPITTTTPKRYRLLLLGTLLMSRQ